MDDVRKFYNKRSLIRGLRSRCIDLQGVCGYWSAFCSYQHHAAGNWPAIILDYASNDMKKSSLLLGAIGVLLSLQSHAAVITRSHGTLEIQIDESSQAIVGNTITV